MSLKIGQALEDGIQRSTTRVALPFVVLAFVFQALASVSASTYVARLLQGRDLPQGMSVADLTSGPVLPIGLGGVALLYVLLAVGFFFVYIALFRAFVDDVDALTADLFTRRALGAFVHYVLFGVIFFFIALVNVVPVLGQIVFIFLVTALWFAPLRIAAEDDGAVTALKQSWSLTSGNRLRLFGLGFVYVLVAGIANAVAGGIFGLVPYVGFLGTALVSGYFTVLNVATTVAAYEQLTGDDAPVTDGTDDDAGGVTPQPTAVDS
ncbi:hypothetical protein GCM10009037_16450 [Halarchaeum grantii]|uniref:DUF7847 domain-containing protein n=1 Tax=Halarchaeum grantii TaxID=1193105 RepID=A0A830EV47_9EURY|nr:hypothetical protein [Halarchaeum grantii]GGL33530.1 hypothetical protein GCM10009037_16450 [Halarchaeum grantii]